MKHPCSGSDLPWRHYPWLAGLFLSPFLFGSITAEGQAMVGVLMAISLVLLAPQIDRLNPSIIPPFLGLLALMVLILPLVPIPAEIVQLISPKRAQLTLDFPIEDVPSRWIPLSISPAKSIQRISELSLLVSCFWLANRATAHPGFSRQFALMIGTALLLLAASDVWFRMNGKRSVFGLWQSAWGTGAGTFSNRNHFASWISLGSLFCLGWILRSLQPLQSARAAPLSGQFRSFPDGIFLLLAVSFGFVMAVTSGSRGGFFAFLTGTSVWIMLLARRSQNRKRWWLIAFGLLAVLGLTLASGDFLLHRLVQVKLDLFSRYPKLEVWRQAWSVFCKFPVLGTGWGTFVTALELFKTSGGLVTFWHAENDYVELLLETGTVGMLVYGGLAFAVLRAGILFTWSRNVKMEEPELIFGALAALAGFAIHALFDFIAQVTAISLLAAALLGFVLGSRERTFASTGIPSPSPRRLAFNYAWASLVLAGAILQGLAGYYWQSGLHASSAAARAERISRALTLWPWATHRQILLTRAQVHMISQELRPTQLRLAGGFRQQFSRILAWDPYDWELRLERAWLDLAFSTNSLRAFAEAREVVRLNPLQPQIPLRFARHYLEVQRPDLTLLLLSHPPRLSAEKLLAGKAHYQMGNYSETIRLAESFWLDPNIRDKLLSPATENSDLPGVLERWKAEPQTSALALELAESICQLPPQRRDLDLLGQLATRFPQDIRLRWLIFQTELARQNYEAAAAASLQLADRLASQGAP